MPKTHKNIRVDVLVFLLGPKGLFSYAPRNVHYLKGNVVKFRG